MKSHHEEPQNKTLETDRAAAVTEFALQRSVAPGQTETFGGAARSAQTFGGLGRD